jgi:hypothetical protein
LIAFAINTTNLASNTNYLQSMALHDINTRKMKEHYKNNGTSQNYLSRAKGVMWQEKGDKTVELV